MIVLETITFKYAPREDRVLAAINAGKAQAWSFWLTRRLALALLERAAELLANTSALAQRVPADIRGEVTAFEREAAIAGTAKAMSNTPTEILKKSETGAELVDRVTISSRGNDFQMELKGDNDGGAAGPVARVALQRILQMLQAEVSKADWLGTSGKTPPTPASEATGPKPARH
jgi:hypothetical protein